MRTSVRSPVDQLISTGRLRAVYQPIVELEQRSPVAFEALARGPAGSAFESPAALFDEAERSGSIVLAEGIETEEHLLRARSMGATLGQGWQLEAEAFGLGGEVVIMATFQDATFFTPATRARYERLADRAALVGALGVGDERAARAGGYGAQASSPTTSCAGNGT